MWKKRKNMNYVAKCAGFFLSFFFFYSVAANFINILTATLERGESDRVTDEQY